MNMRAKKKFGAKTLMAAIVVLVMILVLASRVTYAC